jgi:hypothetical protein
LEGEDVVDSRVQPATGGGFQEDGQSAPFQIYEKSVAAPFQIYQDGDKRDSGGDTATFSVFGEILKHLDEPRSMPYAAAFSVYVDDDSVHDIKVRNDGRSDEMWVRSFSLPSYTRLLVQR